MRLLDLEACFYRHGIQTAGPEVGRTLDDGSMQWGGWPQSFFESVKKIRNADSVMFLCPLCFQRNAGTRGTHRIRIDLHGRNVPDEVCIHNAQGQPVRWAFSGTSLEDLTLSPSILLLHGCAWHGWVQNGQIVGGLDAA